MLPKKGIHQRIQTDLQLDKAIYIEFPEYAAAIFFLNSTKSFLKYRNPVNSQCALARVYKWEKIMKHHKYLIVGGGMTADSAVHGIRKIDQEGAIAMICEERHLPYDRPPLTKSLWKGSADESIWRNAHGLNVAMHLAKKVVAVDPSKKTATDDAGNVYTYEKLLLATGGSVRSFPGFGESIIYFRTADDYLSCGS